MSQLWLSYEGVDIFKIGGLSAYHYATTRVELDADGSPRAYGPNNSGLDLNANAGFPDGGWRSVLVADPADHSRPLIGPNGFFVCKTSLQDPNVPATDQSKYVDAETIPYIVFPGAFLKLAGTGDMGDLVMARNLDHGQESAAIVADAGPTHAPLGEISLCLAANLGGHHPNPRTGAGGPRGRLQYVVFPKSRGAPPWQRDLADIDRSARALLEAAGGWPEPA